MNENFEYLKMFTRFPFSLQRFLRYRLTVDEARILVRERINHREENFLRVAERNIYGSPRSPYFALLKMAGCEFGDLRALVNREGSVGALKELRAAGVYVTYEELKGRIPIVRNQFRLSVSARDFDNPFAHNDFKIQTSGSTGLAQSVNQNLDAIADETPFRLLTLQAYGILGSPMVLWSAFLPGATFRAILMGARMGEPIKKWFAPSGWRDSKYWFKYDLATIYMLGCIRSSGYRVPFPQIARLDRADTVARYMHGLGKLHPTTVLHTGVSRALRACLAAQEHGLDLTRCVIWGGGEPATPAKVMQIRRAAARFIPSYAMTELGIVGYGCPNATDITDVHLRSDGLALFTYPQPVGTTGVTVPALNVTTLLGTSSKLLINAQIDDYGIVEESSCGCELGSHGYTTHIRGIQSYSKLVNEGATLIGSEMIPILEHVLPARFGGSSLDYQLQEEEDERGLTRLCLVISPLVTIKDEQQVLSVLYQALTASSPMADAARAVWHEAHTIQIKRRDPVWTERGKLLPILKKRPSLTK